MNIGIINALFLVTYLFPHKRGGRNQIKTLWRINIIKI